MDPQYSTAEVTRDDIGQTLEELTNVFRNGRRNYERRWYDNNFFYDGYHFRYFSRAQNKIVDLSERQNVYAPLRAIPKASLQVDGLTNLLTSRDFVPVVYPKKIDNTGFTSSEEHQQALLMAKEIAKKNGHFVLEEFKAQDMDIKIPEMVALAAKHFVSFIQIWADYGKEEICSKVYDAFDIMLLGEYTELEDVPAIIKITPKTISEIKANRMFDRQQVEKINPDNRHASSEIKEAYMRVRFGREQNSDSTATLLLKEAFIKERLSEENRGRIQLQKNAGDILKDRKDGDIVMRHTFAAGNIWLRDEYLAMKTYPFVDFRWKPGPLYQVPPIERFIPANKSLDVMTSRIERYFNTMVSGIWMKRQGEQFQITNEAGGQVVEYRNTPPEQADIKSPGGFVFNTLGFMSSLIEEQGLTTSTLGKLPKGVKAHAAIESLKESEYASLVVATKMLKKTTQRIAMKMMEVADEHYVEKHTVYNTEKGQPAYFDIIGKSAMERRNYLKVPVEGNVFPIDSTQKVEIDVQTGLAYTKEGQKQAAKELGDYMIQLVQLGMISPEVVKTYLQQLLQVYQFGATEDIMEAVEKAMQTGGVNEQQLSAIKTAVLEVMSDLVKAKILPTSEERVKEVQVGVAEVINDLGDLPQTAESKQKMAIEAAKAKQDMDNKERKADVDELKAVASLKAKQEDSKVKQAIDVSKAQQDMRLKEMQTQVQSMVKFELAKQQSKNITGAGKGAQK